MECFDNPKVFTGVVKIRKGLGIEHRGGSQLQGGTLLTHALNKATPLAVRPPADLHVAKTDCLQTAQMVQE